jgi:hypothetical protein
MLAIAGAALTATLASPPPEVYAAPANSILLSQPSGSSLNVVGNQVLSGSGQLYIPEGISVFGGLEDTDYTENLANDDAQIVAAAQYWHANTIRLQVAESNLFTHLTSGKTYNDKFLQTIVNQVDLVRSLGMVAVINDQTEFTSKVPGPTNVTSKFWSVMAQTFGNQPYVIFDLFNEPRIEGASKPAKQSSPFATYRLVGPLRVKRSGRRNTQPISINIWNLWKNGGRIDGVSYVGMQTLVDQVRGYGVSNLIWVEGPNEARLLPSGGYLIKGSNLVYSIHHPNLNNPSSWNQISNLSSIAPVVDGEWAQYASTWAECYSRAYTNAPKYLNFLLKHNVGVIAWSLQANSLVRGNIFKQPHNTNTPSDPKDAAELKVPTKLSKNYTCGDEYGQGVGQLLQTYFSQNSARFNPVIS